LIFDLKNSSRITDSLLVTLKQENKMNNRNPNIGWLLVKFKADIFSDYNFMSEIFSGLLVEIANYPILSGDISNFQPFSREFKSSTSSIFVFPDFGLVLAHTLITK